MKLSTFEQENFEYLSKNLLNNENVLKMQNFIQHGRISTYDHCVDVAKTALHLNKVFKLNADEKTLVESGILHDFYLYDWHNASIKVPLFQMHGYTHAKKASINAKEILNVDDKTCEVIKSHMWPLTITSLPLSKEAWLICIADKLCSTKETLFKR